MLASKLRIEGRDAFQHFDVLDWRNAYFPTYYMRLQCVIIDQKILKLKERLCICTIHPYQVAGLVSCLYEISLEVAIP